MELKIDTAQAIELAKKDVDSLATHSRITVNSQPTFEQAKGQLIILKTVKKNLTTKKDSVVKPLNEALKNVRALFKPIEEKVETIEKYLNGEILRYNQKLLAEQRKREEEAAEKMRAEAEAKRKAEEEARRLEDEQKKKEESGQEITEEEKKNLEEVQKAASQEINMDKITKKLDNTNERLNQIKTRKIKKLRIVDINLIPREYLLPNEAKIKEDLLNNIAIPGAEIYEDEIAVNSY